MRKIAILCFALLASLILTLIGCGSGDDDDDTDVSIPTVKEVILAGDASAVATNAPIMIVMSKSIAPVSVPGSVTLNPHADGDTSYDPETRIVAFTPRSDLQSHTGYSLTVSNLTDTAGNMMEPFSLNFMTSEPDNTPPMIDQTIPKDGEEEFSVDAAFTIEFSERINQAEFGTDLALTPDPGIPVERWVFTWSEDGKQVEIFVPLQLGLEPERRYTLSIGRSSVVDLAGNKMEKSLQIGFKTAERKYEDIDPTSQTALQQEWIYIIWKDPQDIWHIIWGGVSPAGATKRGQGTILSKEGDIDDVTPVLWEAGDVQNLKDGVLTFNGAVNGTGGTDGLEFRVSGETVTFRLQYARPEWIFIGKDRKHPQATTFTLLNEEN